MAELSRAQKLWVVQRLACFRSCAEVAEEFTEVYGVPISVQQVFRYSEKSPDRGEEWGPIYDATRAAFLKDSLAHAIAHQAFRFRELTDLYRMAKSRKNLGVARELLEQAAKESGGAFTNKRLHSGAIGSVDFAKLTDDQLSRVVAGEDLAKVLGSDGRGWG